MAKRAEDRVAGKLDPAGRLRFVCQGHISEAVPPGWFAEKLKAYKHINVTLRSVGLISTHETESRGELPLGSGFVIAPGIVVGSSMLPSVPSGSGKHQKRVQLKIEFSRSKCIETPAVFSISEVLYYDSSNNNLVMKLEARPDLPFPEPIPVQFEKPTRPLTGETVFVVGHPFEDLRMPFEVFQVVFPPPYGVKRFALGKLLGEDNDVLGHDCSTTIGDGGAPLVSLMTGKVLGIHLGGSYLKRNFAKPIWDFLRDPAVQQIQEIRQLVTNSDRKKTP